MTAASEHEVLEAMVAHHRELSAQLGGAIVRLEEAIRSDAEISAARAELVRYLRTDILPHAAAEEEALYPAAARIERLGGLVEVMVAEHHHLEATTDRLETASDPLDILGLACAISDGFDAHAAKENRFLLPALELDPDCDLAAVLEGMHAALTPH